MPETYGKIFLIFFLLVSLLAALMIVSTDDVFALRQTLVSGQGVERKVAEEPSNDESQAESPEEEFIDESEVEEEKEGDLTILSLVIDMDTYTLTAEVCNLHHEPESIEEVTITFYAQWVSERKRYKHRIEEVVIGNLLPGIENKRTIKVAVEEKYAFRRIRGTIDPYRNVPDLDRSNNKRFFQTREFPPMGYHSRNEDGFD